MNTNYVMVCDHPLLQDKMARLRDAATPAQQFRTLLHEITHCLGYEACRELPLKEQQVTTPMETMGVGMLEVQPLLVPILRAGIAMTDAMLQLLPTAQVGHVGLYRDHDLLEPVEYYVKLPKSVEGSHVFILDPMLATGGSAAHAAQLVLRRGQPQQLTVIAIVAAPVGIQRLQAVAPNTRVVTAAIDLGIDAQGYILPGLGDAGDRLYNTTLP